MMNNCQRRLGGVCFAALIFCSAAWAGEVAPPAAKDQPLSWLDVIQTPMFSETAKEQPPAARADGQVDPDKPVLPALPAEKPWEVKFKAYGWIPGLKGHAGVGPAVKHLDISYDDVIDNLDLIESMAPVNLEVRCGQWGFYADLFYAKLADTIQLRPRVNVNVEGSQTILELAGFYRACTWPVNESKCGTMSLDVIGGARFNRLQGGIGVQAGPRGISVGGVREWWDPFIGPRLTWQANDKFSMFVRGDVGGFGIEHCSTFAWQFVAGAEYDICKNVFIEAGYRLLDTSYHTGSGRSEFTYDMLMQGPYLAFGVKF